MVFWPLKDVVAPIRKIFFLKCQKRVSFHSTYLEETINQDSHLSIGLSSFEDATNLEPVTIGAVFEDGFDIPELVRARLDLNVVRQCGHGCGELAHCGRVNT